MSETPSSEYPYWKRNLVILWLSQFFSLCGFSMSVPFAPYFMRELATTATEPQIRFYAAMSSLLCQIAFALTSPLWGSIADRYGRKKMVLRAASMGVVVLALMGFCQSVFQFLALRLLQGIFTGTIAASTTLIACNTPQEKQGYALGILSSSIFSGDMTGLLIGGVLASHFGFRTSFHVSALLLVVTTSMVLFLVKEKFTPVVRKAVNSSGNTNAGGTWTVVLLPALPVLCIYGIASLARLMDQSQIALYVEQLNGGPGFAGREMYTSWIMGAGSLGAVTAGFLLSKHIDNSPARIAMRLAIFAGISVLLMAALPFIAPPVTRIHPLHLPLETTWAVVFLLPLRFLMVFCAGGMEPICTSWISKVTEPQHRGVMFGYAQAVRSSCSGLGHLSAGIIAPLLGINALYWTIPLPFFLLAIVVMLFQKRIAARIQVVANLKG